MNFSAKTQILRNLLVVCPIALWVHGPAVCAQDARQDKDAFPAGTPFKPQEKITLYAYNDGEYLELKNDIAGKIFIAKALDPLSMCVVRGGSNSRVTDEATLRALANHIYGLLKNKMHPQSPALKNLKIVNPRSVDGYSYKLNAYDCAYSHFVVYITENVDLPGRLNKSLGANHYKLAELPAIEVAKEYARFQEYLSAMADYQSAVRDLIQKDTNNKSLSRFYSVTVTPKKRAFSVLSYTADPINAQPFFWSTKKVDGEGYTCTITYDDERKSFAIALNKEIQNQINSQIEGPVKYSGRIEVFYQDVNQAYANFDVRDRRFLSPKGSVYSARGCKTFVGTASDVWPMVRALDRSSVDVKLYSERTIDLTARSRGFKTSEDFLFSKEIGADSNQITELKNRGIANISQYGAVLEEISRMGYAATPSVSDVIQFIDDKKEGSRVGLSALQVRQKRIAQQKAQKAASERAFQACLSVNGYHKTKNSAQRAVIERKCR